MDRKNTPLLHRLQVVRNEIDAGAQALEDSIHRIPGDEQEQFLLGLREVERLSRSARGLYDAIAEHEYGMSDYQYDLYVARIEEIRRVFETMFERA